MRTALIAGGATATTLGGLTALVVWFRAGLHTLSQQFIAKPDRSGR